MRVQIMAFNPLGYSVDRKAYDEKTVVQLEDESIRANIHGIDDEQLAVIWSTGQVESISLIVKRADGGHPFASITVALPGFTLSYFWSEQYADADDDAETLIEQITLALARQGEGDADTIREKVKALTGATVL